MTENIQSFEARIKRFDPDFKPTLWRRWRRRERQPLVVPARGAAYAIVFAYVVLTAVKLVMHQELGAQGYDARVVEMAGQGETGRVAAKLMFRDPIMDYVASRL